LGEFHPLAEDEKLWCVSDALGRFEATYWTEHVRAEGIDLLSGAARDGSAPLGRFGAAALRPSRRMS
jgi:hypothetical protein